MIYGENSDHVKVDRVSRPRLELVSKAQDECLKRPFASFDERSRGSKFKKFTGEAPMLDFHGHTIQYVPEIKTTLKRVMNVSVTFKFNNNNTTEQIVYERCTLFVY